MVPDAGPEACDGGEDVGSSVSEGGLEDTPDGTAFQDLLEDGEDDSDADLAVVQLAASLTGCVNLKSDLKLGWLVSIWNSAEVEPAGSDSGKTVEAAGKVSAEVPAEVLAADLIRSLFRTAPSKTQAEQIPEAEVAVSEPAVPDDAVAGELLAVQDKPSDDAPEEEKPTAAVPPVAVTPAVAPTPEIAPAVQTEPTEHRPVPANPTTARSAEHASRDGSSAAAGGTEAKPAAPATEPVAFELRATRATPAETDELVDREEQPKKAQLEGAPKPAASEKQEAPIAPRGTPSGKEHDSRDNDQRREPTPIPSAKKEATPPSGVGDAIPLATHSAPAAPHASPVTHISHVSLESGPAPGAATESQGLEAHEIGPAKAPEPPASAPVSEIRLRLGDEGTRQVDVQLSERGGELRVSVRSADLDLNQSLRNQIQHLVTGMERAGYHAEPLAARSMDSMDARQDDSGRQDQNASDSRQQQQQQRNPRQGQDSSEEETAPGMWAREWQARTGATAGRGRY